MNDHKPISLSTAAQQGSPSGVYRTQGKVISLALQGSRLTFCDGAGSFAIDLPAGTSSKLPTTCVVHKLEGACPDTPPVFDTRHPLNGAQDIIDTSNNTFFLAGDIRDCAVNGNVIALTTNSRVLLLDDMSGSTIPLSPKGGQYVALSAGWVAWNDDSGIHAISRALTSQHRKKG